VRTYQDVESEFHSECMVYAITLGESDAGAECARGEDVVYSVAVSVKHCSEFVGSDTAW